MGLPKDSGLHLRAKWPRGAHNLITDVPGVTVGHVTRHDGDIHTGVTVILPHQGNLFRDKVMAGASVINGFGKSAGLVQVEELGCIETPIVLTNTLSVGTCVTALVRHALSLNPDIGVTTGTVNALVTECNDGRLNDIRGLHVTEADVFTALSSADTVFEEGAVGGGSGMVCLGVKGGIGSASRILTFDGTEHHIGALVMSNFGSPGNLMIGGKLYDTSLINAESRKDTGSIIIIMATDIPLSERQLRRTAKRATFALGRVGSYGGNGSGDIAIAFTTANRIPHYSDRAVLPLQMLDDERIDAVFSAAVEVTEEAIVSSLYHAETTVGVRGNRALGLRDFIKTYMP